MDELIVADVDADMREGAAQGIEEDEIAGLQFSGTDGAADAADLFAAAGQHCSECFVKHETYETAAVEPRVGCVAAEAVLHAEKRKRPEHDLGAHIGRRRIGRSGTSGRGE